MTRTFVLICIVCMSGCSQSKDASATTSGTQQSHTQTIKHGRVTLVARKIEEGTPNESAVNSGLDSATALLNELLQTEEFSLAKGTLAGRFRVESDGSVNVFMTDRSKTSFTNDESSESELENPSFWVSSFRRNFSFPDLGDIALVYAEFQIEPAQ